MPKKLGASPDMRVSENGATVGAQGYVALTRKLCGSASRSYGLFMTCYHDRLYVEFTGVQVSL